MQAWQSAIGNQAAQRSLRAGLDQGLWIQRKCASCENESDEMGTDLLQKKLAVNEPGDVFEQEADRVANAVMSGGGQVSTLADENGPASVQRACACGGTCNECQGKTPEVQRMNGGSAAGAGTAPAIVHEVVRSPGAPLAPTARSFLEPRFGRDFSQVRVHTDSQAAKSARSVNALAYTVGNELVFDEGQYKPETRTGQLLLAHELTHVLQQSSDRESGRLQRQPNEGSGKKPTEKKPDPSAKTPAATGHPCGGTALADSYTPTENGGGGKPIEVSLEEKEFGNTSKFGAFFEFDACIVKGNWQFYLKKLTVPIASKVRPLDFRTNIENASDKAVTKTTFQSIIDDLRPDGKATFPISCGGNRFRDKVKTYSQRNTFWNHQFVVDHEAFHRKEWNSIYRPNLVEAEKAVWSHSIPGSSAKSAQEAVQKERAALDGFMVSAYQATCKTYAPTQESHAYNDGAPKYQKLVDDIQSRAKKEKW